MVATPIGHSQDLTLRALRVLREVSLLACEDTRHTARLLAKHGIATPRTSFFEHNERWKGDRILEVLRQGRDVALVSDAGTPGISDPGYRLVRDARQEGLPVIPVPGPNAAIAALSVSGLPTDRFLFVGFLPPRGSARRAAIQELSGVRETLVIYESPLRTLDLIDGLIDAFGDRLGFLCREATKLHEEYLRGPLSELRSALATRTAVKGEVVLVVEGAPKAAPKEVASDGDPSLETLYARLKGEGRTRREAVKAVAKAVGRPAREVYARILELETQADAPES